MKKILNIIVFISAFFFFLSTFFNIIALVGFDAYIGVDSLFTVITWIISITASLICSILLNHQLQKYQKSLLK